MAYAVSIEGFTPDGKPGPVSLEPAWWDAWALMADPRFVRSQSHGYDDYDADLSVAETAALHAQFRPRTETGLYADDGWRERIAPQLAALDAAFADPGAWSHFHVRVYSWESGY